MTINSCDMLKDKDEVFIMDERNKIYYSYSYDDFYHDIAKCKLNDYVPEDIVIHFETAKNILLYSWYSYRLTMPAKMHLISTVEFSLRERTLKEGIEKVGDRSRKTEKAMLSDLFNLAITQGWINSVDFKKIAPNANDTYPQVIKGAFINFRNGLAHGSTTLLGPTQTLLILEISNIIINTLFKK